MNFHTLLCATRSSGLRFFITTLMYLAIAGMAQAEGGLIEVDILGHYTDDQENGNEEWTFEVQARDVIDLDGKDWTPTNPVKNMWTGDSSPNNNDWHDLEDRNLFRYRYEALLPSHIQIKQWGWEDDRGARWKYDCCHWYTNDDDSYGTGIENIVVDNLVHETWTEFDWPALDNNHGIKVRAKVIHAPVIKQVSPAFGCRGDTDIQLVIMGDNFPGSDENLIATLDWEGVLARNFHVENINRITARVDIGPQACIGSADIKVVNNQILLLPAILRDGFEIKRLTDPECAR